MKVFFDNNLSPRIARALNELFREHEIKHLKEKFKEDVTDVEWIGSLSKERGWIVISGDNRITRNPAERQAFKTAKLTGFFLSPSMNKSKPVVQTYRILQQWDKVESLTKSLEAGAIFQMSETRIKAL